VCSHHTVLSRVCTRAALNCPCGVRRQKWGNLTCCCLAAVPFLTETGWSEGVRALNGKLPFCQEITRSGLCRLLGAAIRSQPHMEWAVKAGWRQPCVQGWPPPCLGVMQWRALNSELLFYRSITRSGAVKAASRPNSVRGQSHGLGVMLVTCPER
jgi:hypothetical protein